MKILVTGGAGFIGSHVVDAYVGQGHEVIVVDDLSSGKKEYVHPKARFVQGDICDLTMEELFAQEKPQVLNHHAAQASVARSVEDPTFDASINIIGMINLLKCCVRYGTRKVIFASTGGALYGEPETLPVSEDHPVTPKSPYGVSKYSGENYIRCYSEIYGISYAILRYANVYGPRQDPYGEAGVVAIFTQAMLEDSPPSIFGDGTQTRDFVYASDVARANVLALTTRENVTVNIGTGRETSINELYERIAQQTGYARPPQYAPPRPGDVYRIALNPQQALQKLGWTHEISLDQGLRFTVDSFRKGTDKTAR
jgi:UDP-glucose 4-epimerase